MAYDAIRQSMIGIGFKVDWDEYDKVSKRVDGLSKGTHKIKVSSDDKQLKKTAETAKKTGESISKVGHEASQSSKQVSNATKKMESGYKQAGSSAVQFGNKAKQAVSKSRSGLGDATAETKKLGAGYSRAASQADKLSRSGRRAKFSLKGIDSYNFIRVASGIGKASQKMGFFTTQTKKAKDSVFSMHHIMKTTFGAMSSYVGFSAIGNGIKSIIGEIDDSSKAWQTFQGNMKMNNHSDSFINKTQNDLKDFAQQTIYSASDMANTFAQLDSVGTKHTASLVKGLGGLAATAEHPAQAMESLSTQFTQMASLPKIQYADLKVMMAQAPAATAQIAKSIGMTEGEMIKQVHAGTLSTKTFMDGVAKAGNSKGLQNMATQYKTVGQAADGLRETIGNKLLKTYQSASKVGIKAISSITDALGNIKQKDIDKMAAPALKSFSHFVNYMIKNGPTFADIGKSVFSIGGSFAKGAWSVIADTIGLLAGHLPGANKGLKGVAKNLNDISKHKKGIETFGKVVVGFFAVRKATQFAAALGSVATNLGIIQKTKLPSGGTTSSLSPALGKGAWKNGGFAGKAAVSLAAGGTALDMGLTIYDGFQKGFNTKGGQKAAWSAGGEGIGAAIGSAFGPLGIVVGGQIGKKIGGAFGDWVTKNNIFKNFAKQKPQKGDAKGTTRIGKGSVQRGVLANGDSVYKQKNGKYATYDKDTGSIVSISKGDPLKKNQVKNNTSKYANTISRGSILGMQSNKTAKGGGTSLANSPMGKLFTGRLKIPNPFKDFHPIKWFNDKLKGFHPIKSITGLFKGIKIPNPFKDFHPVKWFSKTLKGFHPVRSIQGFFKGIKIPNPFANFHPIQWFNNTIKNFHPVKAIKDKFSGLKSWFSDLWKSMFSSVSGFFNKIGNKISDLKSIPGKIWKKITGHAKGGQINQPEIAMVGEEGYEVVTNKKYGNRIVGTNGPEITALRGGDHVYPHRDSKKMLGSGLGAGKTLAGFAKGTDKLAPSAYGKQWYTNVHVVNTGKSSSNNKSSTTSKKTSSKTNSRKTSHSSASGIMSAKELTQLSKKSRSIWNSIYTDTTKRTKVIAATIRKNYARGVKAAVSSLTKLNRIKVNMPTINIRGMGKKLTNSINSAYSSIKSFGKQNSGIWKDVYSDTKHYTQAIQNVTIGNFDDAQKGAQKQMSQMHSGVVSAVKDLVSDFGKIIGHLDNYAHSAMANAINQLNKGFSSINGALGQFGGGKSVLKMAHYATGTGPVDHDHFAMVNDATTGPRQEAIIHSDNSYDLPKGNNKVVPIRKGDSVLNGQDTQIAQSKGIIKHYAKGKNSKSTLRSLISKNNNKPEKAFNRDFTAKVDSKSLGSVLANGLLAVNKGASTKVGNPWNAEVWSQMKDAMSGGSAAGGSWMHTPGAGWTKTNGFGASRSFGSHDGVDYSAPQGTPIRAMHGGVVTRAGKPVWDFADLGYVVTVKSDDGWQEIYQEFGGADHIKAHVGQVVKTGDTLATQGGIIGSSTGPHTHIGLSHGSLWDHGGSSTRGWNDISKMNGHSDGSSKIKDKHKKSKNPALTKLVKSQIGSQLKWVSKNLADEIDAGSAGNPGGAGVKRWIPFIKKAADAMHVNLQGNDVARILNTINHESGGNPTVWQHGYTDVNTGRDPARGLLQFIGSTFKNYAVKGHGSRTSGYDQLLALFNDKNWRSDLMWNGGWGPSGSRRFANGGWSDRPGIFGEVPGQPEVAINPKRNSADRLISEAIEARANVSSGSPSGRAKKAASSRISLPSAKGKSVKRSQNVDINIDLDVNVDGGGNMNGSNIKKMASQMADALFDELSDRVKGGQIEFGN